EAMALFLLTIIAALDPLKDLSHTFGAPGRIARCLSDILPVVVVRIDPDHEVVGGGPSESTTPRVKDALWDALVVVNKLRITRLLDRVAIVLNKERPAKEGVFESAPGERRYLVNNPCRWIDTICLRPQGIEAGFEKSHFVTFSGETGGNGPTSRP